MTYFADLTPYEYAKPEANTVNIGWLERGHPFDTGDTSEEFCARLFAFCQDEAIVRIARGFNACPFCGLGDGQWAEQAQTRYGKEHHWAAIGDGEIRVLGAGKIYAAPALVYHYVVEHSYRPPAEFIAAVLNGPQPGSPEHTALIQSLGADGARLAQYNQ